jgi:hypothetical protein
MNKLFANLIGASLLLAVNVAWAEGSTSMNKELSPMVVEQINLANKLIALGDARKDPLLLIAAARLQKSLSEETTGQPQASNKIPDVLARARKMTEGRKDLTGLIDDITAMRSKSYREDCNGLHNSMGCVETILY